MIWSLSFRLRQTWLGSLWIIPAGCALVGGLLALAMVRLDKAIEGDNWFDYDEGTATALLSAILSATISFTGFVFTMLLLVPQFSGTQLSARVLQLIYRDPKLKLIFGAFLGTMIYVFVVMSRIRDGFIPGLSLWLAGMLIFASILVFLAFVSYFVQHLRPATAATAVARQGSRVIEKFYPRPYAGKRPTRAVDAYQPDNVRVQQLRNTDAGGVILAVSHGGLLAMAQRADCLLILPQAVGDYVASGAVVVKVVGSHERAFEPMFHRVFKRLIALGPERTFEQDPTFAFRILVDIAAVALSPAINAPTTAANVIDRIEDLLMLLASRDLAIGEVRDRTGRLRVVLPAPTWEDYLLLAVTEIRLFGQSSIQVVRRLRAMLLDLAGAVPAEYRASVEAELRKLDESNAHGFAIEADRLMAGTGATSSWSDSATAPDQAARLTRPTRA